MVDEPKKDDEEVIVVEAPDDPEPEKKGKEAENTADEAGLEALKKQLADATAAREREAKRADEASQRVSEATTTIESVVQERFYAQEVAVNNALVAAQNDAAAAQEELDRATADGKFDRIGQLTSKLAKAEFRAAEAETFKNNLARAKEAHTNEMKLRAAAAEKERSQPQLSDRAKSWINAHPKFSTDAVYRNAVLGADALARQRGIAVDSDAYYQFVEEQMGERQATSVGSEGTAAASEGNGRAAEGRAASAAASPSRTGTGATGGRQPTRLTLTAAEKSMADAVMSYVKDPNERYKRYALNKQKMNADTPQA